MNLPIIREVSNPEALAVAYDDEDGKTIVEVDEKLSGRARALAIMMALRAHDRGKGSLVLVPLLVYGWDPLTRWVRHNPASAVATAGVATVVGATTLIPWLTGDEQPLSAANPIATLVVTTAPATPTPVRLTPSPEPTRTASAKPTLKPTALHTALPTAPPTRLPSSSPTAAPKTPRPSDTRPPTRHPNPTPTSTRTAPPPTPPPAGTTPKSPTPTAAPPPTAQPAVSPTPQPTPTMAAERHCLLELDVDPLLGVCLL